MNTLAAIQTTNSDGLFRPPITDQSPTRPDSRKLDKSERVFLNQVRPDEAREFLSKTINERLNRLGNIPTIKPNHYQNDHSSPQATANRVLEMARQLLQNSQATTGQISNAVNEGLRRGQQTLEQLTGLPANLGNDINAISKALQRGLKSQPFTAMTEQTQSRYSEYNSKTSASIQLETRDGDIVTIELNRQQQQASGSFQYQDDKVFLMASEQSRSSSTQLQISVRGQLDESEQQAIQQFMGQIETLADKLQTGSLEDVMNEAVSLQMDNSQLASFSVNLRSIEEYRNVERYQQVQPSQQPVNETLGASPLSQLDNFAEELSNIIDNLLAKVQVKEPEQTAGSALREMLQLKQPEQDINTRIDSLLKLLPSPSLAVNSLNSDG